MGVKFYSVRNKKGKLIFKRFPVSNTLSKEHLIKQGFILKKPISKKRR